MTYDIQKRTKILLAVASTLCVLSIVAYGALLYILSEKEADLSVKAAERAGIALEEQYGRDVRQTLNSTTKERALLASLFYTPDNVVSFLGDIEDMSYALGVTSKIRSADERAGGGLTISVDLNGSWEDLSRFLVLLEAYPAPIEVLRVSFTKQTAIVPGKEVSTGEWNGSILFVLTTYTQS